VDIVGGSSNGRAISERPQRPLLNVKSNGRSKQPNIKALSAPSKKTFSQKSTVSAKSMIPLDDQEFEEF
jgi:hypothetical protein